MQRRNTFCVLDKFPLWQMFYYSHVQGAFMVTPALLSSALAAELRWAVHGSVRSDLPQKYLQQNAVEQPECD